MQTILNARLEGRHTSSVCCTVHAEEPGLCEGVEGMEGNSIMKQIPQRSTPYHELTDGDLQASE